MLSEKQISIISLLLSFACTLILISSYHLTQRPRSEVQGSSTHNTFSQSELFRLYNVALKNTKQKLSPRIIELDGEQYVVTKHGQLICSQWITDRMYTDESGRLVDGAVTIDGQDYFFRNHLKQTGVVWQNGEMYVYDDDGIGVTGWYEMNGFEYYLGDDHKPISGWLTDPETSETYYFDTLTHTPVHGLVPIGLYTYAFDEEGRLLRDTEYEGKLVLSDGFVVQNVLIGDNYYDTNGNIHDVTGNQGDRGRIFFPSRDNISVALYQTLQNVNISQPVVNREDSAAYIVSTYFDPVIADHNNQGFNVLKTLEIGDPVYIRVEDQVDAYEVVDIQYNGVNSGAKLETTHGNIFRATEGLTALYTCNANWTSVTVVWIKQVNSSRHMST